MVKNGYCKNKILFFAWDLGIVFLGIPIFWDLRFQNKNFLILGIIEKCIGCFLVYLFLGVFLIKNVKRMCICDYVKNRIGTC